MGLETEKITQQEYEANGVMAAPDRLTGSSAENKQIFDRFARNVLMEKFNRLIDRLSAGGSGSSGAEQIGSAAIEGLTAQTAGGQIAELQSKALHKSGAEEISGTKTFLAAPVLPEPAQAQHPATKGYADGKLALKAEKAEVYSKTEMNAAVDLAKGTVAAINGISGKAGEIIFQDSGAGTISVVADPAARTIKLAARGTAIPANHAAAHAAGGIDPISPQMIGAATANDLDTKVDAHNQAADAHSAYLAKKSITYAATLTAAGWSGSAAPYTQTVTAAGITANDAPLADVVLSADAAAAMAQLEAWGMIGRITTGAGIITATCYEEKPAVDLNLTMKVVG